MKKNNKNRRIALYVIVAVILIALLYLINNPITVTGNTIATNALKTQKYSRADNPDYYSLLPQMPSDFTQIKFMYERGIIRDDPERINESYWMQPEWLPRYQESFVTSLESTFNEGREPVWGVGIFDSQVYRTINQEWLKNPIPPNTTGYGTFEIKNDSVSVKHRFWIRAVPGAVKIFGARLYTSYPSSALLLGNPLWGIPKQTVNQDANITEKYIKVSIFGPVEFNFGTYWPKLSPDYIREIWVETDISKDTPKGSYVVTVNVGPPSRSYQEEQSLRYGLVYTDPNIGMYAVPPDFELFIDVI